MKVEQQPLLDRVMTLYSRFDSGLIGGLDQVYDEQVIFEDPLHRVEGLKALRRYFSGLVQGLDECRFEFSDVIENGRGRQRSAQAVLFWTMHYRHSRLEGGKPLSLKGTSHLKFGERVTYHRDYFDAGAMLYEHLPVLGFVIGRLKARLA